MVNSIRFIEEQEYLGRPSAPAPWTEAGQWSMPRAFLTDVCLTLPKKTPVKKTLQLPQENTFSALTGKQKPSLTFS